MIEKAIPITPYAGLRPYLEDDAPFFFGRDRVRDNIIANLKAKRLTLVFGASGVGKSSVLRAGVAHKLRAIAQENLDEKGKPELAVAVFNNWRDDPAAGLKACVKEAVREALDEYTPIPISESGSLADAFQSWAELVGGDLLIILDQFEDYFFYHGYDRRGDGFAYELARMVNRPDLRVNFLISIRDDAFSKIKLFKEDILNVFDNLMEIEHLDRSSAVAAIEEPVERYNLFYAAGKQRITVEPELVEKVLSQVRAGRLSFGDGGNGRPAQEAGASEPKAKVETPFLQLVMTRLWQEELSSGSITLRLATLEGLGGAETIVQTHLAQVMGKLSEAEQGMAARIFRYLVTPSGGKFALSASDLAESAELEQTEIVGLLEKLSGGGSRILRAFAPPGPDSESRYEIFHDVLAKAVLDWRRAYAQRQRERQAEEEKRLAAEKARAEEKARADRRLRVLSIVIAVLSILTLVGAAIAWWQYDRARVGAESMTRYTLQKANVTSDTQARIYDVLIKNMDSDKSANSFQSVLDDLNFAVESYRRDGNKLGEGITLNSMAAAPRLFGQARRRVGEYEQSQIYYQQAQKLYQEAQALLETSAGPDHPEVATSLNDLALMYVDQGKYADGAPLLERSLSILEKALDPGDFNLADPLTNLAVCYSAQGKYGEAEPLYKRALEIHSKSLPANSPALAESLNHLGFLYYEQGKYAQAEPLFNQSLAIWQNDPDPGSQLNAALSLNGLAGVYRKRGQYAEAKKYLNLAGQYHRELLDTDQITIAEDVENMGLLYADQGDYEAAEAALNQALDTWTLCLGRDHPTIAYASANLASLYYRNGNPAKAEPLFKEAMRIQRNALPYSPELARTLSGLARLYVDSGSHAEAEALFKEALEILERAAPGHPDLADTLNGYAVLLQIMNRDGEASQMRVRAAQVKERHERDEAAN
ncbi:MAG: tetratricopeptide repeat protein [Blastocatellia bacterium]